MTYNRNFVKYLQTKSQFGKMQMILIIENDDGKILRNIIELMRIAQIIKMHTNAVFRVWYRLRYSWSIKFI